jgi:L-fuculose-phosphate aldolase
MGMSPGSSGNVSVRDSAGILITPTGSSLSRVLECDLVRLDRLGAVTASDGDDSEAGAAPSKEWPLHLAVYRERPDVRAIVHLHAPYSTAIACLALRDGDRAPLAALTPYATMRFRDLRVVPYARPGSEQLAEEVGRFARRTRVMLLANHGSIVAAATLVDATDLSEELEAAAMLEILTADRDRIRLSDEQLEDLRDG